MIEISREKEMLLKSKLFITSDVVDKIPHSLNTDSKTHLEHFVDDVLFGISKEMPIIFSRLLFRSQNSRYLNYDTLNGFAVLAAYGMVTNKGELFYFDKEREIAAQLWIDMVDDEEIYSSVVLQIYTPNPHPVVYTKRNLTSKYSSIIVPRLIPPFKMPVMTGLGERCYDLLDK